MILALIGALCIGISLGLLGSGGSILTVPVLVYLLDHAEKQAMAESLAIVGAIALIGAAQYALKKLIDWRSVFYFGLPGMLGSYVGAYAANFLHGAILLGIFAIFMLLAAVMMLRPMQLSGADDSARQNSRHHSIWKLAVEGLAVGALTGLVGAGGGFLIIPALVLLGGLAMHQAVGTSLCIIAMKSATGLIKYIDVVENEQLQMDWVVIGLFIVVGAAGTIGGKFIAGLVNQATLRRAFGVFLIMMGGYILISQAVKLMTKRESQARIAHTESGRLVAGRPYNHCDVLWAADCSNWLDALGCNSRAAASASACEGASA